MATDRAEPVALAYAEARSDLPMRMHEHGFAIWNSHPTSVGEFNVVFQTGPVAVPLVAGPVLSLALTVVDLRLASRAAFDAAVVCAVYAAIYAAIYAAE